MSEHLRGMQPDRKSTLAILLCSIFFVEPVVGQTPGANSIDEYRELLSLSLKCPPGLWKLGDIVTKTEEELVSRDASEFRTTEKSTRTVGGKNKRSQSTTIYSAYFVDISTIQIDTDPPADLPSGATSVRMSCKGAKQCFRATKEDGSISLDNYRQLFFCDRKTADNAIMALTELARAAPNPTTRDPTGLCTFRAPNRKGLIPSVSPGGRPREDAGVLLDGFTGSIAAVSKDSRGRNWAEVHIEGESIGFVPREYFTCDN